MKIIAWSDIHGDLDRIEKLHSLDIDYDLLIVPGDLSIFERDIIKVLSKLSSFKKVLLIPGNHEESIDVTLFDNIFNIHKTFYDSGEYRFLGLGHGGFSEFDPNAKILNPYVNSKKKNILITHAPPYGTNLDILNEKHIGNKTISKFIKKNKFNFVLFGHLHEKEGQIDFLNGSTLINCGIPFKINLDTGNYEKILI